MACGRRLQLSRPEVSQVMQSSTRKIVGAVRGRTTHDVLIGGQVALTLVMLAGAGAAMKGFLRLLHTPWATTRTMSCRLAFRCMTALIRLGRRAWLTSNSSATGRRTVPGVTMAAISSNATPPSNGWETGVEILGQASLATSKKSASIS